MRRDPKDPNIVWMTEDELRDYMRPKWWLWVVLLSGPLGVLAAQLLWVFVIRG